jgi:hypothetical protein
MDWKIIKLVTVVSIFIFAGCKQNPKNEAYSSSIDSVITLLQKSKKDFETAPHEKAEEIEKQVKAELAEIQKLVRDTLSRDAAILIGQYANIIREKEEEREKEKSAFEGKENSYISKELKYSLQQLQDLKHDLQSGNMNEETFKKNFLNECRASARIMQVAEMKIFRWKQIVELKDSLGPSIQQLTDSLKNKVR